MTVIPQPDFEAEVLDLDDIPEPPPADPDFHDCASFLLDAQLRLVGTRRRYQVCIWWDWQGPQDELGISISTATEAAIIGISEHAERGGLLKVILGDVTFTARVVICHRGDVPTIAELFRHEPFDWGLRGDPYLWKDMRDFFQDWVLPDSIEVLERRIAFAFERLTGASIDNQEPIFNPRYDMGGMSSGHVDPRFWRDQALVHLRERFAYSKGWKRPNCPYCDSADVAEIVYGEPSVEMMEGEEDGSIVLGGCCVTEDDPEWYCWRCDRKW